MGDTGPNNATWGYAFRGQRIITAALTQLVQQHGMGLWPAGAPGKPRLLFGGCSAGARGAMVNLDRISATLNSLGVDMQARPYRMTWQRMRIAECVLICVFSPHLPSAGCWAVGQWHVAGRGARRTRLRLTLGTPPSHPPHTRARTHLSAF
jgi:hypothetical protein